MQREFRFGIETCKLNGQFPFVACALAFVHKSVVFKIFFFFFNFAWQKGNRIIGSDSWGDCAIERCCLCKNAFLPIRPNPSAQSRLPKIFSPASYHSKNFARMPFAQIKRLFRGMGGNDFSELSGWKTYCSEPQLWTTKSDGRHSKRCGGRFCRGFRVPWCRVSHVQQWMYSLSCLQILMNSAAMNHLFHGVYAASAAMDPAEGAGCHCRVPRCRKSYVQQWILQKVQSASTECCRAECCECSEKSGSLFVLAYLEIQSIFFWRDFTDFPWSNSITLVSESACSFWNSLRQEYKLEWCFFELPNFIASYGIGKGSKSCACKIWKVRIVEVQGRRFVNARESVKSAPKKSGSYFKIG